MKNFCAWMATAGIFATATAYASEPLPQPGPEQKKLEIWLGDWTYELNAKPSPLGPAGKSVGSNTVKRILNGAFIEFRGEENGPSGAIQWMEIDGYDASIKRYRWTNFASDGSAQDITYTIDGQTVPYSGTQTTGEKQYLMRGKCVFTEDFSSNFDRREMSTDGKNWIPVWEGKAIKSSRSSSGTHVQSSTAKPGPEHKKLSIWFGEWAMESDIQATPLGPAGKFIGEAKVRPILDGFFMEWLSEGNGPGGPDHYFEVDGYDAFNKKYTWNGFDSDGSVHTVSYSIDDTKVAYTGTVLVGEKQYKIRGTTSFSADLTSWFEKRELSVDGQTWMPNFQTKGVKTKAGLQEDVSGPAVKTSAPRLQELGDLLIGRWTSDVTWAVDYPGLGKKGEKVTGFDVWRWTADGAALESDWLGGATSGRTLMWWDASAKQIRTLDVDSGGNWAQGTITKQGTKWKWTTAGAFSDGRRVEYESEMTFPDIGQSRINAGATILEGVRNEFRDAFKRVAK